MDDKVEDFSPDAAGFRLLVPFPDGSESFVHGFEAGMIWQRMQNGEAHIGGLDEVAKHIENLEVFRRMAAAMGYDMTAEDCGDGCWSIVTFERRRQRFTVIDNTAGKEGG
jgi:hypothetical protein